MFSAGQVLALMKKREHSWPDVTASWLTKIKIIGLPSLQGTSTCLRPSDNCILHWETAASCHVGIYIHCTVVDAVAHWKWNTTLGLSVIWAARWIALILELTVQQLHFWSPHHINCKLKSLFLQEWFPHWAGLRYTCSVIFGWLCIVRSLSFQISVNPKFLHGFGFWFLFLSLPCYAYLWRWPTVPMKTTASGPDNVHSLQAPHNAT